MSTFFSVNTEFEIWRNFLEAYYVYIDIIKRYNAGNIFTENPNDSQILLFLKILPHQIRSAFEDQTSSQKKKKKSIRILSALFDKYASSFSYIFLPSKVEWKTKH